MTVTANMKTKIKNALPAVKAFVLLSDGAVLHPNVWEGPVWTVDAFGRRAPFLTLNEAKRQAVTLSRADPEEVVTIASPTGVEWEYGPERNPEVSA